MPRRATEPDWDDEDDDRPRRPPREGRGDRGERVGKPVSATTIAVGVAGGLLLVGCCVVGGIFALGFRDGVKGTREEVTARGALPAATSDLRARSDDVHNFYWERTPFRRHEHEGRRVVFKESRFDLHVVKVDGAMFALTASDKGFKRPRAVFSFKTADVPEFTAAQVDVFIEGVLKGPTAFASQPWAKGWVPLTPHDGFMRDHFVWVDEAVVVLPPKT